MATEQKSKITLTAFRPQRIGGYGADVNRILLGHLVGKATDLVERSDTKDPTQVFTGLKGDFECRITPNQDGTVNEPVRSGVLFLPDAFQAPLEALLVDEVDANGVVVKEGAKSIAFAFEISAQRAKNPAGYEWIIKPLIDTKPEDDPLAEMRSLLPPPAPAVAQIAAPAAETAPAKTK